MLSSMHEFQRVKISHVCRQGNRPTHLLAKHAFSIVDFFIWIEKSSYFFRTSLSP